MRFDFTLPFAGSYQRRTPPRCLSLRGRGEYWSMTGERTFPYFVRLDECLYAA